MQPRVCGMDVKWCWVHPHTLFSVVFPLNSYTQIKWDVFIYKSLLFTRYMRIMPFCVIFMRNMLIIYSGDPIKRNDTFCPLQRGALSLEVENSYNRTFGTLTSVLYSIDVFCWGVSFKRGLQNWQRSGGGISNCIKGHIATYLHHSIIHITQSDC